MFMSFCRKSVHYSFLSLTTSIDTTTSTTNTDDNLPFGCQPYHHGQYHISSSLTGGGLGLISAIDGDIQRLPNVMESPSVKSTPPSSPDYIFTTPPRKDPGGMGFIDDMGGGVDGLMSCTESLGFESSDERRFDDKIEEAMVDQNDGNPDRFQRSTTKKMKWKREVGEVKKFPPPLSSLRPNGQRNFFLRAVRKDGRLELTEVKIERTEILRASREDGRLRLHLIRDDDIQDSVEEEEEEEEEDVVDEEIEREQDKEEKEKEKAVLVEKEEVQAEEKEIVDVEEVVLQQKVIGDFEEDREKESAVEEWEFPLSGEGFRWCHELMSHHDHHHHPHHHSNHHHNLHVWRQHCVTTG
ncbi:cilia- and flagella-associated protein 251 [Juglans microcarpa x Juglans regia]|uniref:cilia- and flagella-associated protein 251 n=1 Tax=Juglans microcarpa x Juglans regia TaxID=2249226 RepID=UPI001B7E3700|nr:cilia- and flagella-associated protein 251 [Juglans microcarpa x Juglans regia]